MMLELSDPSKAKSDIEWTYLYRKRQYELNKKWIFDILYDITNNNKTYLQAKSELSIHLNNLKELSNFIIRYEEGQKTLIKTKLSQRIKNKINLKLKEIQTSKNKTNISLDTIHDYWQFESNNTHNNPINYLSNNSFAKADYILKLFEQFKINKNESILELGCGIGTTLNHIYEKGYDDLSGIESNQKAIDLMLENYPALFKNNRIYHFRFDQVLHQFVDKQFNLTFCFAVLSHIHPKENHLFSHIARITNRYIITIEAETTISERHFPRNYSKIFTQYGFKEIKSEMTINKITNYPNMRCRVFERIKHE